LERDCRGNGVDCRGGRGRGNETVDGGDESATTIRDRSGGCRGWEAEPCAYALLLRSSRDMMIEGDEAASDGGVGARHAVAF
jgi:hypothetical protein